MIGPQHNEVAKPLLGFLLGTFTWVADFLQFGTVLIGLGGAVMAFASAVYMFRANRLTYKLKSDEWFRLTQNYLDQIERDDTDGSGEDKD